MPDKRINSAEKMNRRMISGFNLRKPIITIYYTLFLRVMKAPSEVIKATTPVIIPNSGTGGVEQTPFVSNPLAT